MLALILPLLEKFWKPLAGALLVGGFLTWLIVHERNIEHAKDATVDARAVTHANTAVAKDDATAATEESHNAIIYEKAVAVPAVGDIGVLCQRTARGRVPLSAPDAGKTASAGNAAADSTVGPGKDISGAILTRAHDAVAQILYLQGRIAELEKQMNDAP